MGRIVKLFDTLQAHARPTPEILNVRLEETFDNGATPVNEGQQHLGF